MKRLEDQTDHGVLTLGDHDDRARQDFAFTLRNFVTGELMPSNRIVYEARAKKAFEKRQGRPPETSRDVRAAMDEDGWYRFYLSARRTSQELIWSSVTFPVERELTTLNTKAKAAKGTGGTLTLNPDVRPPSYSVAVDIHCMPGGYAAEVAPDDASIGAVYDRGVYLYLSGLAGGLNDAAGWLAAMYLKNRFPEFGPKRILDMGCGVGHATLPYVELYPDAEVTAIDTGPGMLRYAHARAESLGCKVHFVQADAEDTGFPDGSFDLVVSSILLHETSGKALPRILAESKRLLSKGGMMAHLDQPRFVTLDAYQSFMQENETYYNNEPFWIQFRKLDLEKAARDAGFAADEVSSDVLTSAVVMQNQNNEKIAAASEEAKRRGFYLLMGRA
jgi:ubiquinone/menaquinone biosynthesis C-methylase UbiE